MLNTCVKFTKGDYVLATAAFLSFVLSVTLWFSGQREAGLFVGLWVPTIFGFGAYLKSSLKAR